MNHFKSFLVVISLYLLLFLGIHFAFSLEEEINIYTPLSKHQVSLFSYSKAKKVITNKAKKKKIPQKKIIQSKGSSQKQKKSELSEEVYQENKLDNQNIKPFGNRIPKYPIFAKNNNIEGFVKLKLLINEQGKVIMVKTIEYQGHSQFVEEAEKVAKQWVFPFLTSKGKRVKAWVTQIVRFKIKN